MMISFRGMLTVSALLMLVACTTTISPVRETDARRITVNTCQKLANSTDYPWVDIDADSGQALYQGFREQHADASLRKIAVFIDGSGDTKESSTNIWKLFSMATLRACDDPIIPFYLEGVGSRGFSKFIGMATGRGMSKQIKTVYQNIAQAYRPGDEIYLFGFSRGAYAARSVNGMIEFAKMLNVDDPSLTDKDISRYVEELYSVYNQYNDGMPRFEERLKHKIAHKADELDIPLYHDPSVQVTAIGVFESGAALGIGRDDNPDNHRVNLYAQNGYHAISIDEQRHDFRPIFFGPHIADDRHLDRAWFPGTHADVGGGNENQDFGLPKLSRDWMLDNFAKFDLFPSQQIGSECKVGLCETAEMHDGFVGVKGISNSVGLHWRYPEDEDVLHGSVLCRTNIVSIPKSHPREEGGRYHPENLLYPLEKHYKISSFPCTDF